MNSRIQVTDIKGKEDLSIIISPSNNIESVCFNDLFSPGSEIEFKAVANANGDIIIQRKSSIVSDDIEAK